MQSVIYGRESLCNAHRREEFIIIHVCCRFEIEILRVSVVLCRFLGNILAKNTQI